MLYVIRCHYINSKNVAGCKVQHVKNFAISGKCNMYMIALYAIHREDQISIS